jgi:transcriptional regulator GlxA family with amidase domain
MKIAFVVYDGMTLLDFAGAFDPVTRLKTMGFVPDLRYDVCAIKDRVRSFEGVEIASDMIYRDLSGYDYVIVPGGDAIRELMSERKFLEWITVKSDTTTVVGICGGALLLGAAGMLRDARATTHPGLTGFLNTFAKEVSGERIVEDNHIITAGGVTSAIDAGLFICEKIAGRETREKIQRQMDYHHYTTK